MRTWLYKSQNYKKSGQRMVYFMLCVQTSQQCNVWILHFYKLIVVSTIGAEYVLASKACKQRTHMACLSSGRSGQYNRDICVALWFLERYLVFNANQRPMDVKCQFIFEVFKDKFINLAKCVHIKTLLILSQRVFL